MAQGTSGTSIWGPFNRGEPKFGNASNTLALSNLLTKTLFCSYSLSVGPPGSVQSKERLANPQRDLIQGLSPFDPVPPATTVNIYTPILFNHDVTLGHHLNAIPSSVDPQPTISGNDPAAIAPELLDQSSDTVGIIKLTVATSGQQGASATVTLNFGAHYWEVDSWSTPPAALSPNSLPIVLIAPVDENGANIWAGTVTNPPGVIVESNAGGFTLLLSVPPLQGGLTAHLQYMVIGTQVPQIAPTFVP